MMQFDDFFASISDHCLTPFSRQFEEALQKRFYSRSHGDWPAWQASLDQLPELTPSVVSLDNDTVTIGTNADINDSQRSQLETALRGLHPWRKGPFRLFDVFIDTEWRSDWKWRRIAEHIQPLEDRTVLDVGCGNGYHCWRMAGAGARYVLGIDPSAKFLVQFAMIKKYLPEQAVHFLPLRSEDLPGNMQSFDTVFSMGILYHRPSPFEHLSELRQCLRPDGELVLETLVIEGKKNEVLVPEDRYAKMPNVWFLPSCETLCSWLVRAGYKNIKVVDMTRTSVEEQRRTDWMTFESLTDFLDPENPNLTVEGLPAPTRATIIASK